MTTQRTAPRKSKKAQTKGKRSRSASKLLKALTEKDLTAGKKHSSRCGCMSWTCGS